MKFQVNKLYEANLNYGVFLVYCFILLLLSILINQTLLTREFYFKSFENMQKETIEQIIDINQKWGWLSYIMIPLKLIIKICIVGIALKIGFIFINVDIRFVRLINVALIAEAIFVLFSCVLCFSALGINSLKELQSFPSLSLYSLLSKDKVPSYFSYLCRSLSLTEVIYCFVLAYGLTKVTNKKYLNMLTFVLCTYVPVLLFWLLLISYFSINLF